jgi:hypothetical protein
MNLNQWIRFDRPGIFRVSVITARVRGIDVSSNEVAVTVVTADAQWQKEQLAQVYSIYEKDQVHALCDLGSAEAAIEMAGRLGGEERTFRLYEMGIIRSPFKATAIRELNRLLTAPDAPITDLFLDAMANVSIDPDPSPAEMMRQAASKGAVLRQQLLDVIPMKRGAGLAISANTLLHWRSLREADRTRIEAILAQSKQAAPR